MIIYQLMVMNPNLVAYYQQQAWEKLSLKEELLHQLKLFLLIIIKKKYEIIILIEFNKPLSDGTQKPRKATVVIRKHGKIILNT